ncbi:MAG: hypothetical protein ACI8VR_001404 [Candidatus Azotimanducaceae bacterium]|jgi:hypothetical protein
MPVVEPLDGSVVAPSIGVTACAGHVSTLPIRMHARNRQIRISRRKEENLLQMEYDQCVGTRILAT